MDRLGALSTGTKLLLGAGVLLFVDMFLRWQEVCVEVAGVEAGCAGRSGWGGFWGVVLGLLTIALLVWVGLQVAGVDLSSVNLPVTEAVLTLGLGVLILVFALLKNLIDDYSTIWSYVGVVLAALVAAGAYLRSQELGGTAPLRTTTGPDTDPPPPDTTVPPPA